MADLVPVDHDPFGQDASAPPVGQDTSSPPLVPVDHDPFAVPTMSMGQDVARSAATGALQGVASTAGLPTDLWHGLDRGYQHAVAWALTKAGLVSPEQAQKMIQPLTGAGEEYTTGSDAINKTLSDAAGGYHTPQTTPGNYAREISSFVPGAIALGGASKLSDVPATVAKYAVVPGAASEAAGEATKGTAYEPYARVGAAVAAGPIGSGLLSLGTKGVNAAREVSSPVLNAYSDLGVDPVLAGDVTGNSFLRGAQAFATKAPFSSGRMEAAGQNAVDQFGNAIEDTAAGLGTSRTLQQAGAAVQQKAQDWLDNFRNQGRTLWGKVSSYVPDTDRVPVTNYRDMLDSIGKALPDAQATAQTLQPALTRDLYKGLVQDIGTGDTLSWQSLKGIRTRIGEMLSEPQVVADTSTAELKRLYGALSDDMALHVSSKGRDAQTAFNTATNYTRAGHEFLDSGLGQILKKGVTPEQAAQTALSGAGNGGSFVQRLRDQMPGAADELAAYKLRDMALATGGKQGPSLDTVSPGTFLTDLANMAPEARAALFADPAVASKVKSAATVAGTVKQTAAGLNHSGTGPFHAMGALGALPLTIAEAARAGHEVAGLPGMVGGAAIGALPAFAGPIAGRMTSTPALTRVLAAPGMELASPVTTAAIAQRDMLAKALRGP